MRADIRFPRFIPTGGLMRAVWTAAILVAGIAPLIHAQATQSVPFIAMPSDLALQGLLAGSYTTD